MPRMCGGALAQAEGTLLLHPCLSRYGTPTESRHDCSRWRLLLRRVAFLSVLTPPTCNILYVYIWNCFLSITKMTGLLKVKVVTLKQFPPHGRVL